MQISDLHHFHCYYIFIFFFNIKWKYYSVSNQTDIGALEAAEFFFFFSILGICNNLPSVGSKILCELIPQPSPQLQLAGHSFS